MQHHAVNCYGITIILNRVTVHNFVENSYEYDTMELLEKHNVLTSLLEMDICKHILMVSIVS